jgi:arginase
MKRPGRKLAPCGAPVILGIPLDHNSSFLRGSAAAPALIRAALHSDAWNKWAETGVDIGREGGVEDAGDLRDLETADACARIKAAVAKIVEDKKRPVNLGGDHSVTYPILRAVGKRVPGITLVPFDAHPDL